MYGKQLTPGDVKVEMCLHTYIDKKYLIYILYIKYKSIVMFNIHYDI